MNQKYPCDGFTRAITPDDIKVGNVVRMFSFGDDDSLVGQAAFSDCVIMGVNDNVILLGRPMMWHDGKTHVETIKLDAEVLYGRSFVLVLLASGEPYTMIAARG